MLFKKEINLKRFIPKISASRFVLLAVLINTLLYNVTLYFFIASKTDLFSIGGVSVFLTIVAILFIVNLFVISLLALITPVLVKFFLILTGLINSAALFFMMTYQVILDRTMMGNILNTEWSEAVEFFNLTLLVYVLVLGVVPGWLIIKTRIENINRGRILVNLCIMIILSGGVIYFNSTSWLWMDKYGKVLGGKMLPWSYIINTARYHYQLSRSAKNKILLPQAAFADDKKTAVVFIIGEAARAHNFSLYGYTRKTNPLLETSDAVALKNTTSCTTYTTGSIACMLSHTIDDTNTYEPLPSYLSRLGADVIWRTNNWGEPPIKVNEYQKSGALKEMCTGEGCYYDEVLLTNLNKRIQSSDKQKIFVVLHTKGSHGPSYYTRYPQQFEKYKSACKSVELSTCTPQELINAYDNTILYTDYFLNKTIEMLKKLNNVPVLLLYISDHGESLGEYGLYLHGTPYYLAPDVQKNIPFIVWMSKSFRELKGYSEIRSKNHYSQANIFHTIIGAFNLNSEIYDNKLDILYRANSLTAIPKTEE